MAQIPPQLVQGGVVVEHGGPSQRLVDGCLDIAIEGQWHGVRVGLLMFIYGPIGEHSCAVKADGAPG